LLHAWLRICGASVVRVERGHRLTGTDVTSEAINGFLGHLETRNYSPSTIRAYAFDLSNFTLFLDARSLGLDEVGPTDLFDYLDWQQGMRRKTSPPRSCRSAQREWPRPR
jgi:integrase/recombinase XerC